MPLKQYIEHLYFKRFGKERPDMVLSIEERVCRDEESPAPVKQDKGCAKLRSCLREDVKGEGLLKGEDTTMYGWRGIVGLVKPTYRPGSLERFIRLLEEMP